MTDLEIPHPSLPRGIWVNRTLNLRSIRAIGYDMDYTLVHYRVESWERHAYDHVRDRLIADGWPVGASPRPSWRVPARSSRPTP